MGTSRPVFVPVNLVSFRPFMFSTGNHSNALFWLSPSYFPVITGKVSSLAPGPRGTLVVNISLIKAYKAGRLTITQVGETMSVKLVSQCKKCPLLRRGKGISSFNTLKSFLHLLQNITQSFVLFLPGGNYIIMGQVDEDGRGTLAPGAFTALYKAPHDKLLMNINNQPC